MEAYEQGKCEQVSRAGLGAVCPGGAGSSWGETCFMQDSLLVTGVKAEVQVRLLFCYSCSWLC